MARNFTANWKAQAANKGASFYRVLEIDWGGTTGTVYYLDRPANSFAATGQRVPASGVDASVLVTQWPSCALELHEGQIGFQQQTQVTLNDEAGALTAILNIEDKQRKLVTVWLLFDDPSTVWPTDAAQVFTGVLRPFDWKGSSNEITLNLGDLGPLLAKSISIPASKSIFANVPTEHQDKQLPLAWGRAQRVEAVCVQRPWETTITQSLAGSNPLYSWTYSPGNEFTSATETITVTIADDPSDMGVDGTGATSYPAKLGTQNVTVTFHQSSTPGNGTSTATITAGGPQPCADATIAQTVNGAGQPQIAFSAPTGITFRFSGTSPDLIFAPTEVNKYYDPSNPGVDYKFHVEEFFTPGWPLLVVGGTMGANGFPCTLGGITPHQPFQDNNGNEWYEVSINDPSGFFWANVAVNDRILFLNPEPLIYPWAAGTKLRQTGVSYTYVANALPSNLVVSVEGFGTVTDNVGTSRKDFIPLGNTATYTVNGTVITTVSSSQITINRNDNTWNNPAGTLLGQNVTTITFTSESPRDLLKVTNPSATLDDNRIWVTLWGVEDAGDGTGNLISNPATIILQYLENTHLMNVASGSINVGQFTTAATALAGYSCGFAQIEAEDGLTLLQHIAQFCNSYLFFDQGQANIVVMSDTPGTIVHTFDTSANDNILQGSLEVSESSVDDIVNDITFKWRAFWDDKTGNKLLDSKNVKLTSVAAFGRMSREPHQCKIYYRRSDVATQRDWWLSHLSSIFRYVKFTAFLDALILQPCDWISVTWIDGEGQNYFGGAKSMMVTKVTDTGKDGLVDIEARFVEFIYT